jgi:hypothetical protein
MSPTLYYLALVTHVAGITIMAGTTFIDFVAFRTFWRVFKTDQPKGLVLESFLYKLQLFIGIGMLIILLSGVLMMVRLHEVWGAQLWFRIKMGMLVLIIINGLILRRTAGSKLKKMLAGEVIEGKLDGIKRNFTAVQLVQILLFLIIYVLSVFKFN